MLYGLFNLSQVTSSCSECGYFDNGPFQTHISEAIKLLLLAIRPQAISMIESLKFSDVFLQSAIGNSYGDIYETHLEWAKNSRLNQKT